MIKRIAIVEDNVDMQLIYRMIFRKYKDMEIGAQFSSAEEALGQLDALSADIIIIDISLPGMSGIDLTKVVRAKYPRLPILVVTGHDRHRYLNAALEAGADVLITKGDARELVAVVKKLLDVER
jgi:DNA-binding NarL/FixJ family response regulator